MSEMKFDGLFLGIGHEPNTSLFKGVVMDMDAVGYLKTKPF